MRIQGGRGMKRGKRYLAALIIVAMVFANVEPGVWAALTGTEKDVLFEIEASDLIAEIEEAAVGKLEMGDVDAVPICGVRQSESEVKYGRKG